MRKKILFLTVALLVVPGCASDVMQSYVGKDITEAALDYGPPVGAFNLPDGRRAFTWRMDNSMTMPSTTTYSGSQTGNWINGTAITTGGGTSTWTCNYTLIGKKNKHGSYTVVDFRKPSLSCE